MCVHALNWYIPLCGHLQQFVNEWCYILQCDEGQQQQTNQVLSPSTYSADTEWSFRHEFDEHLSQKNPVLIIGNHTSPPQVC